MIWQEILNYRKTRLREQHSKYEPLPISLHFTFWNICNVKYVFIFLIILHWNIETSDINNLTIKGWIIFHWCNATKCHRKILVKDAVADPGFSQRGHQLQRGGASKYWKFPKTAWKWRYFAREGCSSLVPPKIHHWDGQIFTIVHAFFVCKIIITFIAFIAGIDQYMKIKEICNWICSNFFQEMIFYPIWAFEIVPWDYKFDACYSKLHFYLNNPYHMCGNDVIVHYFPVVVYIWNIRTYIGEMYHRSY